jgi:hypothetical protein
MPGYLYRRLGSEDDSYEIKHNSIRQHSTASVCEVKLNMELFDINSANYYLLFQQLLELRSYRITDLRCRRRASNVLCCHTVVDGDSCRLVDLCGDLGQAQRVLEHHAHGQDGRDGVDDTLAGDVGGGAWGALVAAATWGNLLVHIP